MYRVFLCNESPFKRCIDNSRQGFENDTFDTKEEAEVYAYKWAFPVSDEVAKQNHYDMNLNEEYELGVFGASIKLMIVELTESSDEAWDERLLGNDENFVEVVDIERLSASLKSGDSEIYSNLSREEINNILDGSAE